MSKKTQSWEARGRRICKAKRVYETKETADAAAFGYRMHHGTILTTYQCRWCGKWHLTKEKKLTTAPQRPAVQRAQNEKETER